VSPLSLFVAFLACLVAVSVLFVVFRAIAWVSVHGAGELVADLAAFVRWLVRVRGEAVVEWQDEEPPERKSSSETVAAEDQAIAVAAASNDDHFALWEAEMRERAA